MDMIGLNQDRGRELQQLSREKIFKVPVKVKGFSYGNNFSDLMRIDDIKKIEDNLIAKEQSDSRLSSFSNEIFSYDGLNLFDAKAESWNNSTQLTVSEYKIDLYSNDSVDSLSVKDDMKKSADEITSKESSPVLSSKDESSHVTKDGEKEEANALRSNKIKKESSSHVEKGEKLVIDDKKLSVEDELGSKIELLDDKKSVKGKELKNLKQLKGDALKIVKKEGDAQDSSLLSEAQKVKSGEKVGADEDGKKTLTTKKGGVHKDFDLGLADKSSLKEATALADLKKGVDHLKKGADFKGEKSGDALKIKALKVKGGAKSSSTNSGGTNGTKGSNVQNQLIADNIVLKESLGEKVEGEVKSQFSKYLKEAGIDKIVKQAKIVLKDGNRGEIKLILNPQKLGTVKIKLNIKDNRIVGKIFVENSSIREAFKDAVGDINRAFADSGFDSSSVDVALSQNSSENHSSDGSEKNFFADNQSESLDGSALSALNRNFYRPESSTVLDLVL